VAVAREDARGALAAYDALATKRPRFASAEMGRAWRWRRWAEEDARRALDRAADLGAAPNAIAKQRALLDAPAPP